MMQSPQSWTGAHWELIQHFHRRHIYESEPEPPPPYEGEDAPPEFNWDDVPSTNPELLCSRCMLAVLKIYSDKRGTQAFGLFLPPSQTCVLCRILYRIQDASALEMGSRVRALMGIRIPFPNLSRAPPGHMKDLVAFWDDTPILGVELGTRVVAKDIEIAGVRAIPKQQLNPVVVRSWLRECEDTHGEQCSGATTQTFLSERKIWLIDTRHFCLVKKTLPVRYVALSYVWGTMQTFRLKEKDIPALSGLEGLRDIEHQLPLTIMDAIEFVRSIEETYLWIDAVCIPQDNPREMEQQIGQMASIYRSAVVTLVAVSSHDASSPLPGVRRGTRSLRSFLETPDLALAERLTSILPVILSSHYNTRAWTFQERLLSTRCLYFTSEQVFMQCQAGIFREDRVAHTTFDKLGRDTLVLKPLSPTVVVQTSPVGLSDLAEHFQLYRQIVEEYTTKSLSYEADILHAFTGVAEELGPLIKTHIVAGMPEGFLTRAMLFQPKRSTFKKRTAEMKYLDPRSKEITTLAFPSWPWCGWVGPVRHESCGSIISHISRVQLCTTPKASKLPPEFRDLEKSIEPQSRGVDVDFSAMPKPVSDIQPFTIRFMAEADTTSNFKFETSVRGDNYLTITGPNSLTCGLVRIDDPHALHRRTSASKATRKDTRNPGLILLCDIEQDLIRPPEKADGPSSPLKPWGPKLYYDGKPWRLCAVLYVQWRGGIAERLGIGEVLKDDWQRAKTSEQLVYLS